MYKRMEIAEMYKKYLDLKGYKPRGSVEKLRAARNYLEYLKEKGQAVAAISMRQAQAYREYLSLDTDKSGKLRYKPSTVNAVIAHLRHLYRYLMMIGKACRNPFIYVEKMKQGVAVVKNILTIEQTGRLLKGVEVKTKADFKFKVLLEILYSTGSRISEIEALSTMDINIEQGYILIRDDKNRSQRYAPLTEYAAKLLRLYLNHFAAEKTKIFAQGQARTLNRWLNDRLKRLCFRLKLPAITCHGIRHSIATHLFKNGAGIRQVQEYLGHKRIKNTEVYTRVLLDDLKKVIARTHPREKQYEAGNTSS